MYRICKNCVLRNFACRSHGTISGLSYWCLCSCDLNRLNQNSLNIFSCVNFIIWLNRVIFVVFFLWMIFYKSDEFRIENHFYFFLFWWVEYPAINKIISRSVECVTVCFLFYKFLINKHETNRIKGSIIWKETSQKCRTNILSPGCNSTSKKNTNQ